MTAPIPWRISPRSLGSTFVWCSSSLTRALKIFVSGRRKVPSLRSAGGLLVLSRCNPNPMICCERTMAPPIERLMAMSSQVFGKLARRFTRSREGPDSFYRLSITGVVFNILGDIATAPSRICMVFKEVSRRYISAGHSFPRSCVDSLSHEQDWRSS